MATKKKETAEVKKDGKSEAIEAITDQINKKYGPGSFMRLGSNKTVNVDVISTGALTLDHALGVGGVPRGRIIEIYGHEASGKTTLTLHIIAEAQKIWNEWGVTKDNEISFYCGTGWRAAIPFLIAYQEGWTNVTLFDGGWYVWQMNPELPIQLGDPRTNN